MLSQLNPPSTPEQAETEALRSMMEEFTQDGADLNKVTYLKHRYAGFTRKESALLIGLTLTTVNGWIKKDTRVAEYELTMSTGKRRELRKGVLEEEWFRNFYLVLQRDAYVLKKVHGLLEEPYQEMRADGSTVTRHGSPAMRKEDWDQYTQLRKMYTPDAWATIEKVLSGQSGTFNIAELILNMSHNTQVNIQPGTGEQTWPQLDQPSQ